MSIRTALVAVAAATLAAAAIPALAGETPAGNYTVIEGNDRYETAANIALTVNPDSHGAVDTLYIANGETLVDAIVVGVTNDGPNAMLLVTRDTIPTATQQALQQIAHGNLVFLGGDDAISPQVREQVSELTRNYTAG